MHDERLLTLMMEECAEIIQLSSKSIRFGLDSVNPYIENPPTNEDNLIQELGDLFLILELLGIDTDKILAAKEHKVEKVLAGPKLDLKTILQDFNRTPKGLDDAQPK